MPKKVNILPNERVDIGDLVDLGQDYTSSVNSDLFEKFIGANYSRVAEGFRVQIANQTTSPGVFTVFNGVAFDRSGQIVNNENESNASRSLTLSVNATYYVEVEFIEGNSDTDARGFWDPSYDNGSDVSGDLRPDGKEFSGNVSTRLSPDWRIVTPISTSGFARTSNPNSLKIPVAILVRAAGVISGGTTAVARSVLAENVSMGASTFKAVNSRIMPDGFTCTVDGEAVTVTANDRENNLLTISGTFASAHTAGTRIITTGGGAAQFLSERASGGFPTTSTTQDARARVFDGNEERGFVLSQNPAASSGRADTQVAQLKDYVDFLASQLRELKFGSLTSSTVGTIAPPSSFSSPPRYFDLAGGVLGARTNTVSVGDGTTSFGDFNVTSYATPEACIQAAHDALPALGGTIYIKGSTAAYDIGVTTVTITKNCILIGDGPATEIRSTGSVKALTINSGGTKKVYIRDMNITRNTATATSTVALTVLDTSSLSLNNCTVHGLSGPTGSASSNWNIINCIFIANTGSNGISVDGNFTNSVFKRCSFSSSLTGATNYALQLRALSADTTFEQCTISIPGGSITPYLVNESGSVDRITFNECIFSGGNADAIAALIGTGSSFCRFVNCKSTVPGGFTVGDDIDDTYFIGCDLLVSATKKCIFIGDTTACNRVFVKDCKFEQTDAPQVTPASAISFDSVNSVDITNCAFIGTDIGISGYTSIIDVVISDCNFENASSHGRYGIYMETGVVGMSITNCRFSTFQDTTTGVISPVFMSCATLSNISISKNIFTTIGTTSCATVRGIKLVNGGVGSGISIDNNKFTTIQGLTSVRAVEISGSTTSNIVINNNTISTIGTSAVAGFNGILVTKFSNLVINNNAMSTLGHSGTITSPNAAIQVGDSSLTLSTQARNVNISNNTIREVAGDNSTDNSAIFIYGGGDRSIVSNNVIELTSSGANTDGIFIADSGLTGPLIRDILVNSNTIIATNMPNGIHVEIDDSTDEESSVIVTSNIVRGFDIYGIAVFNTAGSVTTARGCIVNSNLLNTTTDDAIGIYMHDFSEMVCNNNHIIVDCVSTGTAAGGVFMDSTGTQAVVCGNYVLVNQGTSGAINTSGISGALISSNSVNNQGGADPIIAGTESFIAANWIEAGAGNPITMSGTSKSSARRDGTGDNVALNPSDTVTLSDIGLNYST